MSARTVIKARADGSVSLKSPSECGIEQRLFLCPQQGGFVSEWNYGYAVRQAFKHLHSVGQKLTCPSRDALPALIRSEWRARKLAARKAAQAAS